MKLVKNENNKNNEVVTDEEAREAFVKILKWLGEDPSRDCLLYTSPSPRDGLLSRMPSSA